MIEIHEILRATRSHLGLDVAFVGQFVGDHRVFRYLDADGSFPFREGDSSPIEGSYCGLVAEGRLPMLIPDTDANAITRSLPVTQVIPIGAHLSVPIRLSDGSLFGTFCCFGRAAAPSLTARDLAMLQTFADVTARRIERDLLQQRLLAAKRERICALIASGGPSIVYQPIFGLDGMQIVGVEALSRFPSDSVRPVDGWFSEAAEVGLQVELELTAIRNALQGFRRVWQRHRIQLGLNACATTILDERLSAALDGYPRDLIVIELTEHEQVADYTALLEARRRLQAGGTKFAIDDVGAGHASMRHVLMTRPDILKLDVGLIRSLDDDDMKTALISSLKHFADHFQCRVVAEGVETEQELRALRHIEVQAVQGFLLGRPASCDELVARLSSNGARPRAAVG